MKASVVILAGGKSERMKFPKPFLLFSENKSFLQQIVDEYISFGCKEIFLVLNNKLLNKQWQRYLDCLPRLITIIPNNSPDSGRFHSLKMGLSGLKDASFCFIQDADNPFVTVTLLQQLYENRNENGYTVPHHTTLLPDGKTKTKSGGHPILISERVYNFIINVKQEDLNLKDVIKRFDKTEVEVSDKNILTNINTPSEYEEYFGTSFIPPYKMTHS